MYIPWEFMDSAINSEPMDQLQKMSPDGIIY